MSKCDFRCEHDCKRCKLPDCMNDKITHVEIMEIENRDISYGEILHGRPDKASRKRYKK